MAETTLSKPVYEGNHCTRKNTGQVGASEGGFGLGATQGGQEVEGGEKGFRKTTFLK